MNLGISTMRMIQRVMIYSVLGPGKPIKLGAFGFGERGGVWRCA
jgi:hypothetical protein